MNIVVKIAGETQDSRVFLGWTPRAAEVSLTGIPPGSGTISVILTSSGTDGKLALSKSRNVRGSESLTLTVGPSAAPTIFFVAAEWVQPTATKKTPLVAELTVSVAGANPPLSLTRKVEVRVRKNAQRLTEAERDLFLDALAKVNQQGLGPFKAIREMHDATTKALRQAHRNVNPDNVHFLPWHRAYLLDLERQLQAINPLVALPYWKFDEPAPKVFHPAFMGAKSATSSAQVRLTPGHPLEGWRTEGPVGIRRLASFNEASQSPLDIGEVISQVDTLALGGNGKLYAGLTDIEEKSHNGAHSSFQLPISALGDPRTAPRDPLFYLLHCNVDRLWAFWQWKFNRFDKTNVSSYSKLGKSPNLSDVGRLSKDTMWPWDNIVGGQRPSIVPRSGFPASPWLIAPGTAPEVGSMVDFQGQILTNDELGFDYDDVPYWTGGTTP